MTPIQFSSTSASHLHSLETLNAIFEYDDFMLSIASICDVGCGTGEDLYWWATRTTRDEEAPVPLNIKCTGYDSYYTELPGSKQHKNITFKNTDFENILRPKTKSYDVIWCHDAFQYALHPLDTLSDFWDMLSDNGMLVIIVPQTTNTIHNKQEFNQVDNVYYNYTLVSLIHMLAVSGFDCKKGFFKKLPNDPWISAIVYKSKHKPMDPKVVRWYDLVEKGLLPDSADKGILGAGFLRQRDLVLPWIDKSNTDYIRQ